MRDVYYLPEVTDPDDEEQVKALEKAEKDLLWYTDTWLANIVSIADFGTLVRPYFTAADCKINKDGTPTKDPHITIQSEAWGLVLLANCYDKWTAIFEWKDTNGWKTALPHNKKVSQSLYCCVILLIHAH